MKIAVYSPNWVGDATLALPFIHQLKDRYPDSKIVIVCKDWVKSVFINNPNNNNIILEEDELSAGSESSS